MNYIRAKRYGTVAFMIGIALLALGERPATYYSCAGFALLALTVLAVKVLRTNDPEAQGTFPILGYGGKLNENEAIPVFVGAGMTLGPIFAALLVVAFE